MFLNPAAFAQENETACDVPGAPSSDGIGVADCVDQLAKQKRICISWKTRFNSAKDGMHQCESKLNQPGLTDLQAKLTGAEQQLAEAMKQLEAAKNRSPSTGLGDLKSSLDKALGELDSQIGALERPGNGVGK